MNVNLLRSKMALKGHRDKDLAEVLEVTPSTLSKKLKNEIALYREDIQKIIELYKLTPDEIQEIFFV